MLQLRLGIQYGAQINTMIKKDWKMPPNHIMDHDLIGGKLFTS